MFPRIIVAVDGSSTSDLALQKAISLAQEDSALLRIVHTIDLTVGDFEMADQLAAFEASLRRAGGIILREAEDRARKAGVEVDTRLLEVRVYSDRTADEIVGEADSWGASLLVIGTHGRRGFKRALMGSVAEAVVRIANTPVLLIRGK